MHYKDSNLITSLYICLKVNTSHLKYYLLNVLVYKLFRRFSISIKGACNRSETLVKSFAFYAII